MSASSAYATDEFERASLPLPRDDISVSIFAPEPGVCPKCMAPIEPERLPEAKLCLDCIVER